MGGAAPAADSANAPYLSTGNDHMDHDSTVTPNTDLGDSVMRLANLIRAGSKRLVLPLQPT